MRTLLLTCLVALPAWATSTYPSAVQTHVAAPSTPACTLCHVSLAGGAGTATTPFGTSFRAKGGVGGGNTNALTMALDAMAAANTDSDGDGVPDITELKNGTDPNVANNADGGTGGGSGSAVPPMTYGCGSNAVPGLMGFGSLLLVLALSRRR